MDFARAEMFHGPKIELDSAWSPRFVPLFVEAWMARSVNRETRAIVPRHSYFLLRILDQRPFGLGI